MPKWLHKTENP